MISKTFRGGIHPYYGKELAASRETEKLPLPDQFFVSLEQHIGAPVKLLVKKGDEVKAGQLIAEAGGFVSANIHAPTSGKVTSTDPVDHVSGRKVPAVTIKADGNDEWVDLEPVDSPESADPKTLLDAIRRAGVVGMGGASFPTHVKLSPPDDKPIDTLILNGAECEPYLTADHRIMVEKPREVLLGALLEARILGASRLFIGVEDNKPDAIKALEDEVEGLQLPENIKEISVVPLETKYPQGSEKQLIKAITDRNVPVKGLPMDVGVVVSNVATCYAVWDAVYNGRPVIERIVTVTGRGVVEPGNYWVRIGTPVSHLIEAAGGYEDDAAKLIIGGPMMGFAQGTDAVPTMKSTNGVLVQTRDEVQGPDFAPCIRCARCVEVCPMNLPPFLLAAAAEAGRYDVLDQDVLFSCVECGSCAYVCPSRRPLVQFIRMGKAYFRGQKKGK